MDVTGASGRRTGVQRAEFILRFQRVPRFRDDRQYHWEGGIRTTQSYVSKRRGDLKRLAVNLRRTLALFLTSGMPHCFRVFGHVWPGLGSNGNPVGIKRAVDHMARWLICETWCAHTDGTTMRQFVGDPKIPTWMEMGLPRDDLGRCRSVYPPLAGIARKKKEG